MKIIEEQMIKCRTCKKITKHYRNNTKSSGFMILVHLILILMTVGAWLLVIVVWKLLNAKIGGWRCSECG